MKRAVVSRAGCQSLTRSPVGAVTDSQRLGRQRRMCNPGGRNQEEQMGDGCGALGIIIDDQNGSTHEWWN